METNDLSKNNAELIYEFGVSMGIGFQLMDDYLDAFGDPKKFGKKVGGDILCNKKTILYIEALKRDKTGELKQWSSEDNYDEQEKVESVKKIFRDTQVDKLCWDQMNKYYDQALLKLEKIEVKEGRKNTLIEFSEYIRNRVV